MKHKGNFSTYPEVVSCCLCNCELRCFSVKRAYWRCTSSNRTLICEGDGYDGYPEERGEMNEKIRGRWCKFQGDCEGSQGRNWSYKGMNKVSIREEAEDMGRYCCDWNIRSRRKTTWDEAYSDKEDDQTQNTPRITVRSNPNNNVPMPMHTTPQSGRNTSCMSDYPTCQ